jgi:hypothetical protein
MLSFKNSGYDDDNKNDDENDDEHADINACPENVSNDLTPGNSESEQYENN